MFLFFAEAGNGCHSGMLQLWPGEGVKPSRVDAHILALWEDPAHKYPEFTHRPTGFKPPHDSSGKLLISFNKKKPKRKELGFLFCFKQSVKLLPCYLDCSFPHRETCRLLLFPSHTLSLGSCCRSFPLICLSHSFTECVSLNVIFFCVIHRQTSPGYSAAVKNSKSKWTHL